MSPKVYTKEEQMTRCVCGAELMLEPGPVGEKPGAPVMTVSRIVDGKTHVHPGFAGKGMLPKGCGVQLSSKK
jgi:hypothetical protein